MDNEELLESKILVVWEDNEVEDDIEDEELLEDDKIIVLDVESGTFPGPATICRIFVVVELKLVGAKEIWLLSRS